MTTKKILNAGIIILSLIYFTSCDEMFDERIEGNNIIITKTREISTFDELVSTGKFDVYLTIADSTSLRIEVEENLLPFIITKVSGQKFYVEEKDDYRLDNNKPMKIFLTTPNLEGAKLTGSGFINCDSLTTDFFSAEITGSGSIEFNNIKALDIEAEISGSGDIILEGQAERTDFEITGSGNIRAINLIHETSESEITGSGNIYVYAEEYLNAIITGSGNIYYKGYPDIDKNISGTGSVRRY